MANVRKGDLVSASSALGGVVVEGRVAVALPDTTVIDKKNGGKVAIVNKLYRITKIDEQVSEAGADVSGSVPSIDGGAVTRPSKLKVGAEAKKESPLANLMKPGQTTGEVKLDAKPEDVAGDSGAGGALSAQQIDVILADVMDASIKAMRNVGVSEVSIHDAASRIASAVKAVVEFVQVDE